jgi:hypothetical protein
LCGREHLVDDDRHFDLAGYWTVQREFTFEPLFWAAFETADRLAVYDDGPGHGFQPVTGEEPYPQRRLAGAAQKDDHGKDGDEELNGSKRRRRSFE